MGSGLEDRLSAEHVAKAGAVAEAFESVSERRAVRSVLRARHVAHIGLPAARVATTLQPGTAPPANRWGVLVTIETLARRDTPQHSFASGIRPSTIDHQPAGPAAPNRAPNVPPHEAASESVAPTLLPEATLSPVAERRFVSGHTSLEVGAGVMLSW